MAGGAAGLTQALSTMTIMMTQLQKATPAAVAGFHSMTAAMGEMGAKIEALSKNFPGLLDYTANLTAMFKDGSVSLIAYRQQMQLAIDQLERLAMLNTGKTAADMKALADAIKAMMNAATSAPAPPPATVWG